MNRPTIRHLAIFVRDVDKVAEFYQSVFQMDLIKKAEATATEGKAYFLTDGYLTLAVLPQRLAGEVAHGINHFGFTVEDTAEISRRMAELKSSSKPETSNITNLRRLLTQVAASYLPTKPPTHLLTKSLF